MFEGLQLKAFVLASRPERLASLRADAGNTVELTSDAWLQVGHKYKERNQIAPFYRRGRHRR